MSARLVGDQIRVMLYDLGGHFPSDGLTLRIPLQLSSPVAGTGAGSGKLLDTSPRVAGLLVVDPLGHPREVKIIEGEGTIRPGVSWFRIYPTIVRESASLAFQLGQAGPVQVALYDLRGRRVRVLQDGSLTAGQHALNWDGRDGQGRSLAAGLYIARLTTGRESITRKIVIQR